ncbi:MAG: hypothetical protein HYY97_11830 [Rhodocyclales bacterium]|nr:hypothetical protein [Rhodocyclales bacterium]
MSTPGYEFREAEYLGLGYLAVSSSELLDRLLSHQPIDDDDRYTLRRAKCFLMDVSSGARLVKSGVSSNASAVDSVRKLVYSVEPLKLMQDAIRSAEVGEVFEKIAGSIETAITVSEYDADRDDLIIAKDFFHQLHVFLVSSIESGRRRTSVDFGVNTNLMMYA